MTDEKVSLFDAEIEVVVNRPIESAIFTGSVSLHDDPNPITPAEVFHGIVNLTDDLAVPGVVVYSDYPEEIEEPIDEEIVVALRSFPVKVAESNRIVDDFMTGHAVISRIDTTPQNAAAGEVLKTVKRMMTDADDTRKILVGPLNNTVKSINDAFRPITEKLSKIEADFKGAMTDFKRREDTRIAEERRKAEEIRRAEADKKQREADEQRRKADDERRKADDLKAKAAAEENEAERAKLLKAAEKSETKAATADIKSATAASVASVISATPIVTAAAAKVAGTAFAAKFRGVLVSKEDFVRHCLQSGNLFYLTVDEAAVNKVFQASKGEVKIPGFRCETYTEMRASSR